MRPPNVSPISGAHIALAYVFGHDKRWHQLRDGDRQTGPPAQLIPSHKSSHHEVDAENLERIRKRLRFNRHSSERSQEAERVTWLPQSGLEGFGKDPTDLACEIVYILLGQLAIPCWGEHLKSDQLIE